MSERTPPEPGPLAPVVGKTDPDPDAPVPLAGDPPRPDRRAPVAPPVPEVGESPESAAIRKLAVIGIICIALAAIAGDVFLLASQHDPPAGLIAIGASGVGALATLLAVRSR